VGDVIVRALPGQATLIESWRALARSSAGATIDVRATSVAAVFPAWEPLNNAIALVPPTDAEATAAEVAQLGQRFADVGVDVWAYWIATTTRELASPDAAVVPGLARDDTTLVMCAALDRDYARHDAAVATSIASALIAGDEPLPRDQVEPPRADEEHDAWVFVDDGVAVASVWTYLHDGDCGVYAVGTAPGWRRRGIAHALMEHALGDARRRGARTASLQSTPMGVPLYRSLGFEAVGRYEEWRSAVAHLAF
jgi:ribosomal protein S18 acetylase RimI-like enzyme